MMKFRNLFASIAYCIHRYDGSEYSNTRHVRGLRNNRQEQDD